MCTTFILFVRMYTYIYAGFGRRTRSIHMYMCRVTISNTVTISFFDNELIHFLSNDNEYNRYFYRNFAHVHMYGTCIGEI